MSQNPPQNELRVKLYAKPGELSEEQCCLLDGLELRCFEDKYILDKSDYYWWLAYVNGKIAGFASMQATEEGGLFALCGVLPKYRGKGLQKRLIRVRTIYAKRFLKLPRVFTYTASDNMPSANNLIKQGFKLYEPEYPWGLKGALYFFKRF